MPAGHAASDGSGSGRRGFQVVAAVIAAAPYMHVKKKGTTVSDGLVVQITPFDASVA